jgi:hypothetical protein
LLSNILISNIITRGKADYQQESQKALEEIASGNFNFWSSAVAPNQTQYFQAIVDLYIILSGQYYSTAKEAGYQHWGIKDPAPDLGHIQFINQFMPNARHLFIYRNIFDVIRSYKARNWVQNKMDIQQTTYQWKKNISQIRSENLPNLHIIKYEELTHSPASELDKLKSFLQIQQIDTSILDHKVNTFQGKTKKGHNAEEYIAPGTLSDDESSFITLLASDLIKELGYE